MSAEKRLQNWVLVLIVILVAIAVPIYKVGRGEPAINQGIDLVGGVDLLLQAQIPEGETEVTGDMILGAIDIVRNRLDPEGVREIIIQQMGEDRIVVQIPGEDDPERVKAMIGTTASLRFIDAGSDPIPAGTLLRFVDPETGEPVGISAMLDEEPEEPEPEQPASVIMAEQVIVNPEDLVGFVIQPMETHPTDTPETDGEAGDEPVVPNEEIAVLAVEQAPAGTALAVYTTQHSGEYLVLAEDNTVTAIHEIIGPITRNQIAFPGLAQTPGFDVTVMNANLGNFKVVGMPDVPDIGTRIEVWDPMGGGPAEETGELQPGRRMDITTDRIILTGDDFADADVKFGQLGNAIIGFEFKASGREVFGLYTVQNVRKYLAIALDDKIISCPVIREPILNGRGVIEGSFSPEEAQDLVVKLDSGRLPIPLEIVENRTVGPTLGAKSITDSKNAALLGAFLILLFMGFYYRVPGLMADLALLFYVAVFFGALAILNATLTLPGIAGFILSVGMAVDANVIIFERLKEELKTGKTFRSAVDSAFKRAFLAIFDANVTTLITALVLYNLGTGPIRGFAVTLSLGILVSMFSALVFTRLLLESILVNKAFQKYSYFGIREQDVAIFGKGGGEK